MNPWVIAIQQLVKGATQNMTQGAAGAQSSEKEGYGLGIKQPGQVMQQAPSLGANNNPGPFAVMNQALTGIGTDIQKTLPIHNNIIGAESSMLRPVTAAQGGFVQMPTTVDSSKQQYSSKSPWANVYAQFTR